MQTGPRGRRRATGRPVVAVTFDPHPIAVLRPEHAPPTLDHASRSGPLCSVSAGVDDVSAVPFDREMAGWSPEEFVERVLVDDAARRRGGRRRELPVRSPGGRRRPTLREAGRAAGFIAAAVPLDGDRRRWSSTYVRTASPPATSRAAPRRSAGRSPSRRGDRGRKRGRELGFPTANVPDGPRRPPTACTPAGWPARRRRPARLPSASAPTRPSTDSGTRVEAYVLDRDDLELYGVEVEVAFVERLRGMVRFDGVDAAGRADADDVDRPARSLAASTWRRETSARRGGVVPPPRPAVLRRRRPRAGRSPGCSWPRPRPGRWPWRPPLRSAAPGRRAVPCPPRSSLRRDATASACRGADSWRLRDAVLRADPIARWAVVRTFRSWGCCSRW